MIIAINDILKIKSKELCVDRKDNKGKLILTDENLIKILYIEGNGTVLLKDLKTGLEFIEDINNIDSFYIKLPQTNTISVIRPENPFNQVSSVSSYLDELRDEVSKQFKIRDKIDRKYRWKHPKNYKRR